MVTDNDLLRLWGRHLSYGVPRGWQWCAKKAKVLRRQVHCTRLVADYCTERQHHRCFQPTTRDCWRVPSTTARVAPASSRSRRSAPRLPMRDPAMSRTPADIVRAILKSLSFTPRTLYERQRVAIGMAHASRLPICWPCVRRRRFCSQAPSAASEQWSRHSRRETTGRCTR